MFYPTLQRDSTALAAGSSSGAAQRNGPSLRNTARHSWFCCPARPPPPALPAPLQPSPSFLIYTPNPRRQERRLRRASTAAAPRPVPLPRELLVLPPRSGSGGSSGRCVAWRGGSDRKPLRAETAAAAQDNPRAALVSLRAVRRCRKEVKRNHVSRAWPLAPCSEGRHSCPALGTSVEQKPPPPPPE